MPKLFPPSLLESQDARSFCLQKQIRNVEALKSHLRDSVLFSIDVEGSEGIGEGITSIGVASLPPTDSITRDPPLLPFDTQKFMESSQVEAHCLYLEGRTRRKPHPEFPFGVNGKTTDPGGELKAIVSSIKERYPRRDIVLVGWHPHPRELPAINILYPSLFQEVIGWVDVVDITQQLCVSKQEDLNKTWPPLSDVAFSVGLSEDSLPRRFHHSAGSDAIHTILVLTRILAHSPNEPPIELWRRRPLKHWQQSSNRAYLQ